ncbi:hypothetical protein [Streptomyces sp. NPDC001410]|uniref:hypothetical protein n=1 Tax=Streptomyces sp. NPDC001410 TaxID=3364574 RepID=UPI0036CAECD0
MAAFGLTLSAVGEPQQDQSHRDFLYLNYSHPELQSQLDALRPVCKRIFSEKTSTRVKTRPKLEESLKLAYDSKEAAPDQEVILTVHELKRLAATPPS